MRNSAAFGRLRLPQPGGSPAGGRKAANAALLRIVPDLWSGTMSPCLPESFAFRQTGRHSRRASPKGWPAGCAAFRLPAWLMRRSAGKACRGRAQLGRAALTAADVA